MHNSNECTIVPGPLTTIEDKSDNDSLHSYISKVFLKTVLADTEQLLYKNSLIPSDPFTVIIEKHMQIEENIYKILEIVAEVEDSWSRNRWRIVWWSSNIFKCETALINNRHFEKTMWMQKFDIYGMC